MSRYLQHRVFVVSVVVNVLIVMAGALFPERVAELAEAGLAAVTRLFGWFYMASLFGFIVLLAALAFSRYGKVRLGPQDGRPDYDAFSWISMLLAAGLGVGLVFYGVAEPMRHYLAPPYGEAVPGTAEAARRAIQYSFFNWGVHQWSVFALVGLVIAYFQFRKGRAGLVSSVLSTVAPATPRGRFWAPWLDVFAVVATVMGVATSLGLGVLQVNGGLHAVFGLPESVLWQGVILAVMFVAYMTSTWAGLDKGIRRLSNFNMLLCLVMLVYVLFAGPTLRILETVTLGFGDYLQHFIGMSLRATPYSDGAWARDWTLFYWAWAIAWSPFVGTFVARVSRGRTIREFVLGVLLVPALLACLWVGVFGGAALHLERSADTGLASATEANLNVALFQMIDLLPFSGLLSVVAMLLILVFLVTSADSASYIVAQMTDDGSINPPFYKRAIWGGLIAAICLMLMALGGLSGLQSASVLASLPFAFVLFAMAVALLRVLREDHRSLLSLLYRRHGEVPVGADPIEADLLERERRAARASGKGRVESRK
ncbi:BCCT family transporter [Halomonas beimenensis]|uniref:Choline-glycine betaine transporter n=1 Tax=Halomonas beimenensis TaxID=475662 RepID=A0A291P6X6_9GAMM|nr:BCCT family transporter [Halomonas beimenensis]ATJ82630.1 choline-glycine betaine transporter [Halomonas beimenensis]